MVVCVKGALRLLLKRNWQTPIVQAPKQEKTTRESQLAPTEIQYKSLLERLKGAIQSGELALPEGEEARPFFQAMHEYGQELQFYMLILQIHK